MSKYIVKENEHNVMYHHIGLTRFTGCQCVKDCSCSEDFKPVEYDYYTVKRKNKKTTTHKTLEDANVRWDFVCALSSTLKNDGKKSPKKFRSKAEQETIEDSKRYIESQFGYEIGANLDAFIG